MRALFAVGVGTVLLLVGTACGPGEDGYVEVVREINGAFSPDGEHVLVVRSSYETQDPSVPYFSEENGRDWQATLLVGSRSPADPEEVEGLVELVSWDDSERRGVLEYVPLFWRPEVERVFYWWPGEPATPWLVNTRTGEHIELVLPAWLQEELDRDARFPTVRTQPIPSPDGSMVALYSFGHPPTGFSLAVSFFSTEDGAHLASHRVPWPVSNINPWTVSPDGYQHPLLWARDSSGVYVLDCSYAAFVPASPAQDGEGGEVAEVSEVPGFAVPTSGGPVADDGARFVVEGEENEASVRLAPWGEWPVYGANAPPSWVAFDDVELVPLTEVKFCQPR